MSRHRKLFVLVAALVILAAACGGDSESDSTTSSAETPTSSTPTSADDGSTDEPVADLGEDRSSELLGRWEVTHYTLPDGGGITNVVGDDPVFIEFSADGSVSYNTGCNSGGTQFTTSGTYYVPESALDDMPEGQPISLGPAFEQTERGCEGFLGDQDRDLPIDMGKATRFALDGDRLLLLDEFLLIDATKSS